MAFIFICYNYYGTNVVTNSNLCHTIEMQGELVVVIIDTHLSYEIYM